MAEMAMTMEQQLSLPATYGKEMTPEVARKVADLKASFDIHDKDKVIAFGREQQAEIGKFSESILNGVQTKAVGEAGELLADVISKVKGYDISCEDENKGLFGFLRKQKSKIQSLQTKYKSVADNMDVVVKDLQQKDLAVGQVSRNFDAMYEENMNMFQFFSMAIYAGEQTLAEEKAKFQEIKKAAEASGDMMKIQEASDYNDDIIRFDRRLSDFRLSRAVALQQAPKIKSLQKAADELSESIKTTVVTAIPMWKNQMAMAVGMKVIETGIDAVNAVKDITNAMLIANSEASKRISLKAAEAVERGVIDIETIKTVNRNLIEALSGSYNIAQNAIIAREEGAKELQNSEAELKQAIVQYNNLN